MKGLNLAKIEHGYLSEEIRRVTLEAIQFGIYGVGQEFKMEIDGGKSPSAVPFDNMLEEIKFLEKDNVEISMLQENRIENSIELVRRFPDSEKAWVNLAGTYVNVGEIEQAREAIEKAIKLAPDEDAVKAMLGRIQIFEGNIKGALSTYSEILNQGQNISARETIGMLKLVLGEIDEAISELEVALEEEKKKRPSIERASLYYNLGISHLAKKKYGRAISYFRQCLRQDDNYHIAYQSMGIAYSLLNQKTKAEKIFRIAIELEPEDPEARLNLSRALESQNKWNEVVLTLSNTIQDFPYYWDARESLGRAFLKTRRFKEAEAQFRRILAAIEKGEYRGDLSNAINNVGVAYLLQAEYLKAEEFFKRSIEISSRSNFLAILNLGRTYLAWDKIHKVEPIILELKKRKTDDKGLLNLSARYYYLTDNFDKAIEEAKQVIADDPMDLDGAYIMGTLLADVYENYAEAEKILRNILESGKITGVLLNNLAYTLILAGKLDEARNYLEKITPDFDDIDPGIPMATWGLWYLRKGDMARGASYYNEGSRISKDDELKKMILQKKDLELGIFSMVAGNDKEAKRFFERAAKAVVKDGVYTKKAEYYIEEERNRS